MQFAEVLTVVKAIDTAALSAHHAKGYLRLVAAYFEDCCDRDLGDGVFYISQRYPDNLGVQK